MIRCLYEDHEGVLWVGTGWEFDPKMKEGGLNRFNRETGTFTRYMHDPDNPHSLIGDKVKAIFEDSRGVFWVGTDGDGLHTMDRKTGSFERLTYDPRHPEKQAGPPVKTGKLVRSYHVYNRRWIGAIWIEHTMPGWFVMIPDKRNAHFDSADRSRLKGLRITVGGAAYHAGWHSVDLQNIQRMGHRIFRIDPLQAGISGINGGDGVESIYEDSSAQRGCVWE
jgi:ligand-binding sensor domain-containing protein